MKKRIFYFFGFSLLLTLFFKATSFSQCMLYPVTMQQRVTDADIVIEASVAYRQTYMNAQQDMVYTSTVLNVHKVFKGNLTNVQIELITEGGEYLNTKVVVEPSSNIENAESGIFFLKQSALRFNGSTINSGLQFEAFALAQSIFNYLKDGSVTSPFFSYNSKEELYNAIISITQYNFIEITPYIPSPQIAFHMLVPPVIAAIAPTTTTAGTFSTITITGNNFGASYVNGTSNVQFPDANNGGAGYISTPANHIVSWNNTQIQVWVPTQGGSGLIRVTNNLGEVTTSAISITVNYNETNVNSGGIYYQPDLVNDNGTNGYTWAYNTTFNGNAPAVAAWERALQTWRCGTFVNFNRAGTTALACQALDGTNIVSFDGSCALPAGVLGISYSYYSACAAGVWYVTENDLKFRTNGTGGINWNYGPAPTAGGLYDFESVCLHELGHSHQLGHTITPVTVMNYAVGPNTDRRTLTPVSETAGGNDIMSRSVVNNSCGPTAMVALTAGNCAINAPIANFSGTPLTGCNSLTVTFTDASINTPTSWNWTFTGGVPAAFVGQNPPPVNYAAPGTYTVSLTVSNASGSDVETKTNYITVNNCPPPVADFSALPNNVCAGANIQFTDLSTNSPTSWNWTFPGGVPGSTTTQNPIINYPVPGVYSVTLTATNAYGNNTITKTNYITINNCPPPPTASFTGTPTTLCAGGTVNFTDASTQSPTSWQWSFPGGTPATSIAQNPSVVYNTPGVYNVTLIATNSSGSGSLVRPGYITVNVCSAPTADFAGFPTTVCEGQNVTFVDLSTQSPTSWAWTFTGGTPAASAVQNPVINYATAGVYQVALTATNGFGNNTNTKPNYINVVTCPAAGTGLIVNDGSDITIQVGVVVHVEGGIINRDNGSNIGVFSNNGTLRLQGDWTNSSVSNGFIPALAGTVEFFGAAQQITGTIPTYFNTLSLTGSGVKTQTINAQVDGILNLNDSELATQANNMHIINPAIASLTRTGGFVSTPVQGFVSSTSNGKLVRNTNSTGTYAYHVGSSIPPARYRPVTLKPLSATAHTFGVRFVNNDPTPDGFNRFNKQATLGNINVNWYQRISRTNGTSGADIAIYADDVQDAIASWPLTKLTQWGVNPPPVQWFDMGPVNVNAAASPNLGNVVKPTWNTFVTEVFSFAPQSNPLPVELLSFTGECFNKKAIIQWETASENNNKLFYVLKSTDGINYNVIASIEGKGTTNTNSKYSYTDDAFDGNKTYYKLMQEDFNGEVTVFKEISVSCNKNNQQAFAFNVFPNPATEHLDIEIFTDAASRFSLQVFNNLGQLVMQTEMVAPNGLMRKNIFIGNLAEGIYTLQLKSVDNTVVKRFVKSL
ncbi:MAG TPA: PKD domain-containing protein [Bacteroidia bacterium]|nr:PKD domain-containing protein [Bacteroidia bacterium]HNU32889.1 PKD domain-containing protein [Bacteroidia bacterium]